ncbi:hypothetical protein EDEG_00924 [Edhazardia aedis USNM 41457]|uniref:RuvB-like helicase n=1 Tax=Edhazardia aedis (strain USNM 41457) TaxID=1003232 RepID=J9DAY3_EDHAE|nr:hypothetical protein EDEG_00924 [Edhazardia aedis USNM 41457]|eukprot:EJW04931.1 hypothetical protein EDEG_00924 [Edhazardia aedis USNM 41457]
MNQDNGLNLTTHSHIKLSSEDKINPMEGSLVGRENEINMLMRFHDLVNFKNAGNIVILSGESGVGKTALGSIFLKIIRPSLHIISADVLAKQSSKIEILQQALRKAVLIRLKEEYTVIEGEVIELTNSKILLKTMDMESEYNIGPKMMQGMIKERVCVGDVIQINKETGKVNKIGKAHVKSHELNVVGPDLKFVPCPEGEIQHVREEINEMTLHEMDVLNSNLQKTNTLPLNNDIQIGKEVREQINAKINEWLYEGTAELQVGVLFIDDANYLDLECFKYLLKESESNICPLIVLASNKIDLIPIDFANKSLILPLKGYSIEELHDIIYNRIIEEKNTVKDEAIDELIQICKNTNIKYTLSLLSLTRFRLEGSADSINIDDVLTTKGLFKSINDFI